LYASIPLLPRPAMREDAPAHTRSMIDASIIYLPLSAMPMRFHAMMLCCCCSCQPCSLILLCSLITYLHQASQPHISPCLQAYAKSRHYRHMRRVHQRCLPRAMPYLQVILACCTQRQDRACVAAKPAYMHMRTVVASLRHICLLSAYMAHSHARARHMARRQCQSACLLYFPISGAKISAAQCAAVR